MRQNHCRGDRFHEIIVSTGHESPDLILFFRFGRQENDRDRFCVNARTQFFAHLDAVEFRQHDVKQDDIRVGCCLGKGLFAVVGFIYLVFCLFQEMGYHFHNVFFVIHDENSDIRRICRCVHTD